jgi:hypothetical protein
MKSLFTACIVAFFFYYFIVIELSILVFGYSLLCYRFAFIFMFIGLILSWRLEVRLIQFYLGEENLADSTPAQWYWYYDGKSPYTLRDYLTRYVRYPFF